MIIKEGQIFQAKYDQSDFLNYRGSKDKDSRRQHSALHLGILRAKIAKYLTGIESIEIIQKQVAPDLFFYTLQFSNGFKENLTKMYYGLKTTKVALTRLSIDELQKVQEKRDIEEGTFFGLKDQRSKIARVDQSLAIGLEPLYRYFERKGHRAVINTDQIRAITLPALYECALQTANLSNISLEQEYKNRMKSNIEGMSGKVNKKVTYELVQYLDSITVQNKK